MVDLLAADAGGPEALRRTPPRRLRRVPFPAAELVRVRSGQPRGAGARRSAGRDRLRAAGGRRGPVTLAGAAVQHAAECITGITISQLAAPGAPVVWGGAPSIFDMRTGTTPDGSHRDRDDRPGLRRGGQDLGLPTHAYLGGSDAKCVDAQAGMESAAAILLGALGGINMISGAGMLDFLGCQSVEKLVLDAEAIASARRLLEGIEARTDSLAVDMFERVGLAGEFLKLADTRKLFRLEQHLPSAVTDRGSLRAWEDAGRRDAFARARTRVAELVARTGGPRSTLPRKAGSSTS